MNKATAGGSRHVLLYEPRVEGHHLGWLRFIVEDLLSADWQLTLAADLRPDHEATVREQLGELVSAVTLVNAYNPSGQRYGDGKTGAVLHNLRASGARHVFLCALDEVASHSCRRAAFGIFPPAELRGHFGGIYHRPRFFVAPRWSPNRWLKQVGFQRLLQSGWVRPLLIVDEYLARELQSRFPTAPIFFLPDPCPPGYDGNRATARQHLNLPENKCVFLFYGGGYRRKGLHLAVRALLALPMDAPAFLLCAGRQNPTGETARGLEQLARQNRARLVNRYVSMAEEKEVFAASDVVLLPYLNHYGASGVLSRAVAAGKPVIVSNEQLLGRLVREHGLGLLFPSGNLPALSECIRQAIQFSPEVIGRFATAARAYAERYSRAAYRLALLNALNSCVKNAA
ncbi:MAG: glycosyltransferase family 4 protein [Verrucomicrobiia bacterium]